MVQAKNLINSKNSVIKAHNQLKSILSSLSDSIFVISSEHEILFANKSAQVFFGEKIVGRKCYTVLKKKGEICEQCPIKNFDSRNFSQIKHQENFSVKNDDNERTFDILTTFLGDFDGKTSVLKVMRDITEKKITEQKLKKSEEKYRDLFEKAPLSISLLDIKGNYIDLSSNSENITGFTKEDFVGKHFMSYKSFPEKYTPAVIGAFKTLLKGQIPDPLELEIFKKDGSPMWARLTPSITIIDDNPVIYIMTQDISEKKKAEERLKDSESKFRNIAEQSFAGIFIMQEGKFVYANQELTNITGFSLEEIYKWKEKDILNCIYPEDINLVLQSYRKNRDGNPLKNKSTIFRLLDKNGTIKWVHTHSRKITLENKFATLTAMIDITERKSSEEKLKISEERIRSLIEQTTDAVFCYEYDPPIPTNLRIEEQVKRLYDGIMVDCNLVCAQSYGKDTPEKVIGKKLTQLFRTIPGSLDNLFRKMVVNEYHIVDGIGIEQLPKGKNRYFLNSAHAIIENNNIVRVWGNFRDITEKIKAEQKLKESEESYRLFLEEFPGIAFKGFMDKSFEFFKGSVEAITGYISEDFLSGIVKWEELIHPKDLEAFMISNVEFYQSKDNYFKAEHRILHKNGTIKWISVAIHKFFDDDSNLAGVQGIIYDITEIKEMEKKLKAHNRKIELLNEIILIANKSVNLSEFIKPMFDLTLELMEFDGGGVYIANHERRIAELVYYKDLIPEFVDAIKECPMDAAPYSQIFINGEPIFTENYQKMDPVFAEKSGLLALASVPIFSNKKVIGALNVASKKRYIFSEEEKEMLQYIGRELGTVISKIQAEEDLKIHQERLEELVEERTKELKESEEFNRFLFESLPIGLALNSMDGSLVDINPAYAKIIGRTIEDTLKLPYFEITPKKYQNNDLLENLKQNGYYEPYEKEYIHKDGHLVPVRLSGKLIERNGEQFIWSSVEDITERKLTQAELEESEKFNRFLFKSLPIGLALCRMDGTLIDVNPEYAKMIGRSIEDTLRLTYWEITPKTYEKEEALQLESLEKNGFYGPFEKEYIHSEGHLVPVRLLGKIIERNGQKFIWSSVEDITERKLAQDELEATLEDLKRSNKELEQFAYVASHDLQEPLRMVASFTQLLQRRYQDKLDKEAHEFINFAVDGAKRMQGLISDLLIFSRVGTRGKEFKETDMNISLKAAISNLNQSINENNAQISFNPLPTIFADESQMIQLFQNLISNAIKFHQDGIDPQIEVSGEVKSEEWIFYVEDNGIGIDQEYFEKIFIIFQRLHKKNEYGGTGIGLAVCNKIINRHGGKIWVESELGKGAKFYFSIPKPIKNNGNHVNGHFNNKNKKNKNS